MLLLSEPAPELLSSELESGDLSELLLSEPAPEDSLVLLSSEQLSSELASEDLLVLVVGAVVGAAIGLSPSSGASTLFQPHVFYC